MKNSFILSLLSLFFVSTFSIEAQELTMNSAFSNYKYYSDGNRISESQLHSLLSQNPISDKYWKSSKTFNKLSWAAIGSEVVFGIWEITDNTVGNDNITRAGIFGSLAAAITCSIISHHKKKKALKSFNDGVETSSSFQIKPSDSGVGITLQF